MVSVSIFCLLVNRERIDHQSDTFLECFVATSVQKYGERGGLLWLQPSRKSQDNEEILDWELWLMRTPVRTLVIARFL